MAELAASGLDRLRWTLTEVALFVEGVGRGKLAAPVPGEPARNGPGTLFYEWPDGDWLAWELIDRSDARFYREVAEAKEQAERSVAEVALQSAAAELLGGTGEPVAEPEPAVEPMVTHTVAQPTMPADRWEIGDMTWHPAHGWGRVDAHVTSAGQDVLRCMFGSAFATIQRTEARRTDAQGRDWAQARGYAVEELRQRIPLDVAVALAKAAPVRALVPWTCAVCRGQIAADSMAVGVGDPSSLQYASHFACGRSVARDLEPKVDPATVGALLKAARKRANLTQAQLAKELGVGQAHVSVWERGQKDVPPELRSRLAAVLAVSQEDLGASMLAVSQEDLGAMDREAVKDQPPSAIPEEPSAPGEFATTMVCGHCMHVGQPRVGWHVTTVAHVGAWCTSCGRWLRWLRQSQDVLEIAGARPERQLAVRPEMPLADLAIARASSAAGPLEDQLDESDWH